MDEYLDPFLTSSSWSDVNTEERSFWSCHETDHLNGLLPNSVGSYESDKEISTVSMIDSCHTVESLASQESSSVIPGGDPDFGLDNSLLLGEAQPPQDGHHHEGESFLNGAVNSSSIISYMGLQSDTAKSALSSLNLGSVKELPVGNMTRSPLPFCESDKVRCYGSELSEFQRTCRDFQSLPPVPQLWTPSSFEGAASLSPLGKDNMHGFGIQGAYAASEIYAMGNRYVRDDKTMQLDNLSVAVPMKGKEEWQNHPASSFMHQPQRNMTTAGLQSPSQIASALPSGNCNGAGKPRVRARRGQATDPHSIAERLRREKIAEGMKQLQELVPDNNKTDKASMLDEIIEYVKFLQLQVKVLSMSRLGAAEAVVPLITNSQAEGSNGLLPSPSADQVIDSFQSSEQSTLEREVVKLMESNVTMAMQYLQRKGLYLMPIALATAISSGKRSSSGLVSVERKKFEWSDSALSYSSCSNLTGIGNHQVCPDDCDLIGRLGNGGIRVDSCNGTVLKVEDMNNSTQTVQEVKPNT